MLCKYYSAVHTATTEHSNIVSSCVSQLLLKMSPCILFHEETALRMNTATFFFLLMKERCSPCLMCDEENAAAAARVLSCKTDKNLPSRPLPPLSNSSPLSYRPLRQPQLGNRSLFKSFMSTPQKRKACRQLRERNEQCVIVPLICDDL